MKTLLKNQRISSLFVGLGLLTVIGLPLAISSPAQAQVGNIVADGNLGEYNSVTTAPVLSYGIVGPVVADVQYFLSDQGYYGGAADSIFGDATYDAVVSFQQAQGLPVDGVVGPETWAALFAIDDQIALAQ
jgi:peptidoglycan hydrolase-like protein with peptidoglycan-binding domain